MKYIAALVAAFSVFSLLVYIFTLAGIMARGLISWEALYAPPALSLWNGGWSLVAASGVFWLTLDWRQKVEAKRRRMALAARARA